MRKGLERMQKQLDRRCIDSLKGIGILGIILVHYSLEASNELISGIVFNGARGVQLMFVINGFLIFHSLDKIEFNQKNIISWWKGKFLRLIPLYYFFTILHLLVFGTGERYWLGTLSEVSWLNILTNLLFLHGFHPYFINAINVNWFMADLAIFYIAAPFLYRMIHSLEKACIALFVTVPAGFVLKSLVINLDIIRVQSIWEDYINILSFPSEFPIMLLGILVYYIYKKVVEENAIKHKLAFSLSCLIFIFILLYALVVNKNYFMIYNNIFSFGVIFAVIFISQLIYPLKIIKNNIFSIFGRHSYGIYLSHMFIIYLINKLGISGDDESVSIRIGGFLLVVIITLLMSIVSEELIEKRFVEIFSFRRSELKK